MSDTATTSRNTVALAVVGDVMAVVVFVLIGRANHHEDPGVAGALGVMAPFLVGLAVGWVAARAWRSPRTPFPTGVTIWLVTAGLGLGLRRLAWQRSTALGFVIVAPVFLLLALVGWRMVAEWMRDRKAA